MSNSTERSEDWIKWNGDTRDIPVNGMVDVIFRNGTAQSSVPASNMDWSHSVPSDGRDIVSYRVVEAAPTPTPDDEWFAWYTHTLPTKPVGNYKMEWRLAIMRIGNTRSGEARDPNWELAPDHPQRVIAYRWTDPRVVVFNPVTKQRREATDIMRDPEGKGMADPTRNNQPSKLYDENCVAKPPELTLTPEVNSPSYLAAEAEIAKRLLDMHTVKLSLPFDVIDTMQARAHALKTPLDKVVADTLAADIQRRKDEEDSDLETIDGQFSDLMEGMGASEDHHDMQHALLNLGIGEGTASKMMIRLLPEANRIAADPSVVPINTIADGVISATVARSSNQAMWRYRDTADAAFDTLRRLGYTYSGGEQWKPPVGDKTKILGDHGVTNAQYIHILRNPAGWTDESVRKARLWGADRGPEVLYINPLRTGKTTAHAEWLKAHVKLSPGRIEPYDDTLAQSIAEHGQSVIGGILKRMRLMDEAKVDAAKMSALFNVFIKPNVTGKGIDRRKHNHYFKDVSHLDRLDVYRVIELFAISDPCIQHALKKLLVAGGRGAGKDASKDIQEVIDSCQRWQEMQTENRDAGNPF